MGTFIWIGGSPCSGKSSLAERLGKTAGLPVYAADTFFDQHVERAEAGSVLARVGRGSPQEIFMRPVDSMLADFVALGYEEFPLILADLAQDPWRRGSIVEGCALLPELVAQLGEEGNTVLYLIPTERFQRSCYAERAWAASISNQTSDPDTAWENWRARDALYSEFIEAQAVQVGFRVLKVSAKLTPDEVYKTAYAHFERS